MELAERGWSPARPPLTPARSTWVVLLGSFRTAGAVFTLQPRPDVKYETSLLTTGPSTSSVDAAHCFKGCLSIIVVRWLQRLHDEPKMTLWQSPETCTTV